MPKVILDNIGSFSEAAIGTINGNSDRLEEAFDNTLSRDGSTPNQMEADLDLNSHRILNVAAPQDGNDVVRLQDLEEITGSLPELVTATQSEAEQGVDNTKRMTPLRTKQAIDFQVPTIVSNAIGNIGLADVATSGDYEDLDNLPTLGTMAAETAADYTPTSGLADVAISNDYDDLDNLPTLGTAAAADVEDFATAAQGSLADTAMQPGAFGLGGTAIIPDDANDEAEIGFLRFGAGTPNGPGFGAIALNMVDAAGRRFQIAFEIGFAPNPRIAVRERTTGGSWNAWRSDISGADKATVTYVDEQVSGVGQQITPVRAATTGNITLSGEQTVDGVSVVTGDHVLVKNQSAGAENGVYVVAAGSWTRRADSDTWDEVRGKRVIVLEGTTQEGSGWSNTNVAGGSLGTTAVTYEQSSTGQVYTGTNGIDISGTVVQLDSAALASLSNADTAVQPGQFGWGANNASVNVPGVNLDTLRTNGVYRALSTYVGYPDLPGFPAIAQLLHMGQVSDAAVQVCYGLENSGLHIAFRRLPSGSSWQPWVNISGAGKVSTADNLSDLADQTEAQKNLGVSYPTMRYGATGSGGSTDKDALEAFLDAAEGELPNPQIGAKGSIRMSEMIPGSDLEPCADYINLIWRHEGMEAALRGAAFVFDSARRYWMGSTRTAQYQQGDQFGYFIPPQEATIEWQRPWEFQDWPLASSPAFVSRTATMSTALPATAAGGGNIGLGTRELEVGPGHGLVRGDRIRLIATAGHGSSIGSFAAGKGEAGFPGAKAEDHIVHSITSTTITTFDYIRSFYNVALAQPVVQKYIDEPRLRLINPWLLGPGRPVGASGGSDRAFNIIGGRNLLIEGGRIEDFGGAWLRLGSIMGGSVRDLYCRGTLDSVDDNDIGRGLFYGGAMSDFLFDNVTVEGGGQAFMNSPLGGADVTAAGLGISRRIRHRNLTVKGFGTGAYTQHTEGEDFEYENCSAYGSPLASWGYDIRVPRTKIRGGLITNLPTGGAVAFRTNINGFEISSVDISNCLSGIRLTTFGGNDSYVTPPGDIRITDNVLRNIGGGPSTGAINVSYTVQDGGSYADLGGLVIDRNDVDCASTTQVIRAEGRFLRPQVTRNNIRDGGTGRSISVTGGSIGAATGPRSPIVTDNIQGTGRVAVLIAHASGTVTNERNLSV